MKRPTLRSWQRAPTGAAPVPKRRTDGARGDGDPIGVVLPAVGDGLRSVGHPAHAVERVGGCCHVSARPGCKVELQVRHSGSSRPQRSRHAAQVVPVESGNGSGPHYRCVDDAPMLLGA